MIAPNIPRPTLEPNRIRPILRATPPVSPPQSPWTLDLDFRRDELDPRLVITAPGPKSYWDADGILRVAPPGTWPIEWDPVTGERRGRSVWEARTNLYTDSEVIGASPTNPPNTFVESNSVVAPDGAMTADTLIDAATNGEHFARDRSVVLTAGLTYTFSAYVRSLDVGEALRPRLRLASGGTADVSAQFDLVEARTAGVTAGATASIERLQNGWFRIQLTSTATSTTTRTIRLQHTSATGQPLYLGDGVSGITWWGAQLEVGGMAGPYIPTGGVAATRPAELVTMSDLSWFSLAEGTFVVEAATSQGGLPSRRIFSIGTTSNNRMTVRFDNGPGISSTCAVNGIAQCDMRQQLPSFDRAIAAFAYRKDDFAVSYNGGAVLTDTAGDVLPAASIMHIGCSVNGEYLCGPVARIRYTPCRLSNAELQSLSAL